MTTSSSGVGDDRAERRGGVGRLPGPPRRQGGRAVPLPGFALCSSASLSWLRRPDKSLVHFYLTVNPVPFMTNHRGPQLMEHIEGRLVAGTEVLLKLKCRNPRCVSGDVIGSLKPHRKGHSGAVQDGASRYGGLMAAG